MRHIALTLILLNISCSGHSDRENYEYFSYTNIYLDTLIIDSENEILYNNLEIEGSDVTSDKRYLFNFNPLNFTLEVISLEKLKIEKKIKFDKEGDDGVGGFIGFISALDFNHVVFKSMIKSEIFSLEGKKLKTINYSDYLSAQPIGEEILIASPLVDPKLDRIYLLTRIDLNNSYSLVIMDLNKPKFNRISLDLFEGFNGNSFNLRILGATISVPQGVYLRRFETKLLLSNQVSNELLVYDIEADSIYVKSYRSKISADRKEKNYQFEHESEESMRSEYKKFHQEINYLPPFWDEVNHVFYRFSYVELSSELEESEQARSKIYLSALDKDLNLIGEMYLPQLSKRATSLSSSRFPKHFAKDGKIWIYENINDEMGFVVLTMNK